MLRNPYRRRTLSKRHTQVNTTGHASSERARSHRASVAFRGRIGDSINHTLIMQSTYIRSCFGMRQQCSCTKWARGVFSAQKVLFRTARGASASARIVADMDCDSRAESRRNLPHSPPAEDSPPVNELASSITSQSRKCATRR